MNKRQLKLIITILITFLSTLTLIIVYLKILDTLHENLTNTLETFDIHSAQIIDLNNNPPLVKLNVSFVLENEGKYSVTINLIQAKLYINNEYLDSLNPYTQITSFDVPAGEQFIIFVTCKSNKQKIIEIIINDRDPTLSGNGTIMGHASYFFIRTVYTRQFHIEKTILIEGAKT